MRVFLWQNALRKGLLGGNRTWMTLFSVMGAIRLLRRFARGKPDVVTLELSEPGQAVLITHLKESFATPE